MSSLLRSFSTVGLVAGAIVVTSISSSCTSNKWNSGLNADTTPGGTSIKAYPVPAQYDTTPGWIGILGIPVPTIVFPAGFLDSTDSISYVSYTSGNDTCAPAPSGSVGIYKMYPPADPPYPETPAPLPAAATLLHVGDGFRFPSDPSATWGVIMLAEASPLGPSYRMQQVTYTPGLVGTYDGKYCSHDLKVSIK